MPRISTADLVAAIRARTGETQEEFARTLGVSFTTVNAWERGRAEPRRAKRLMLEELAGDLEVEVAETLRVLVIDDDPVSRTIVEGYVASAGLKADTMTAGNGVDGLIRCGEHRPHLLFLDIMMPGLDGFDVADRVSQMDDLPTEIVFMTSSREPDVLARAEASPAIAVLAKPLDAEIVRSLITTASERTSA